MLKRLFIVGVCSLSILPAWSQEQLITEQSVNERRQLTNALAPDPEKERAVEFTRERNLPTRLIYPDGRVVEIRDITANGLPEYLTTYNLTAAKTVSTDKVWPGGGKGYALSGKDMLIGVWDGGVFRSTHVEFEGRAVVINTTAPVIGHATHVSGTLIAAGIDPEAKGMSFEGNLDGYDWDNDLNEMAVAAGQGLLLSNHSYGYITGWDYNTDKDRWEWYGDVSYSKTEDYRFGYYNEEAQQYDLVSYNNPNYLIVKSAGNDRGEGPSPGTEHYVFQDGDWVKSTEIREKDGGADGFDSMGPVSNAKNILVVGAINKMPFGYTSRENVKITSFSVFGPTDDGRVKPDVVADGDNVYSCYSGSDTDYRFSSGTSMAAPNVTGSLALLQELNHDLYGGYLRASSLKGVVLHTAGDAGEIGPDYKYGFGVLNTLSAADLISDQSFDRIREETLVSGGEYTETLYSNGKEPVKITLCWTDPAGTVPAPSLDPVDRILVNDLDVRLIRLIDGHEYQPYVLDPIHPSLPAVTGDNQLDNVEQLEVTTPEKGFYKVVVNYKGGLFSGQQDFSLVYSGLSAEYFASGLTRLTDNNGDFILTSAEEYIPDMNAQWLIEPDNGQPVSLYFDSFSTITGQDILKVYDGTDAGAALVASFSGALEKDTVVQSSGNSLFLVFTSDGQEQDAGFSAVYCTVPPEGTVTIQGEPYPCAGGTERYLATGMTGVRYSWEPPAGWTGDPVASNGFDLHVGNQFDSLKVVPGNLCGAGDPAWLPVTPLASAPSIDYLDTDTVPCAGTQVIAEINTEAGATYRWKYPTDWLATPASGILHFIPGKNAGTITALSSNACGNGDTADVFIDVKNIPGEEQILTARDKPCALSVQDFYVDPLPEHSYSWEVNDGWSILGDPGKDTVKVSVGTDPNFLFVTATNKCGTHTSNKLFLTSPHPPDPVIKQEDSRYDGLKLLSVRNADEYTGYQWYLDGNLISSDDAKNKEYVAYLPGIYTVSVFNNQGCENSMNPEDGVDISGSDLPFTAYPGPGEILYIVNSTRATATVNIFTFSGHLLKIIRAEPGYNEVSFPYSGAFILTIHGSGKHRSLRFFTH